MSCHGRKGTSPGRDKDLKSSQPQSGGVSLSQNPPRPHLFEADVSAFSSSAAPHWHHHPPISTLLVHHTSTPTVANVRASAVYSQLSPSRSIHALSIPFSRMNPEQHFDLSMQPSSPSKIPTPLSPAAAGTTTDGGGGSGGGGGKDKPNFKERWAAAQAKLKGGAAMTSKQVRERCNLI